jgi:phage-related baseplate assembly protein
MTTRTRRAGRTGIEDRLGRQRDFFDDMVARLSSADLPALSPLTTRQLSDPSIALLDAFASLADAVTFYRERYLNAGYLPTASERRELAGLAALVGYQPRPGVAAATSLAFTMDKDGRAVLPSGLRTQSVPAPGEVAQTFETSEDIEAREEFNELTPRLTKPQSILLKDALRIDHIVVVGTTLNLRSGDLLLLYFTADAGKQVLRSIIDVVIDFAAGQSVLRLAPVHGAIIRLHGRLLDAVAKGQADPSVETLASDVALGEPPDSLLTWAEKNAKLQPYRGLLNDALKLEIEETPAGPTPSLDRLIGRLQPRGLPQGRDPRIDLVALTESLPDEPARLVPDRTLRALATMASVDRRALFGAFGSAGRARSDQEVQAVYALRRVVGVFGQNAPPPPGNPDGQWDQAVPDETADSLFLDGSFAEFPARSHVVVRRLLTDKSFDGGRAHRLHAVIAAASQVNRSEYGLAGPATQLTIPAWISNDGTSRLLQRRRKTTVYGGSEQLLLADVRDASCVGACADDESCTEASPDTATSIRLARLVEGLAPGRVVAVTGRWPEWDDFLHPDPKDATGPLVAELAVIDSVEHGSPPERDGAPATTVVTFAAPLRNCYRRDTVKINANVVAATQGESRAEVLGGGDASKPAQRFALKQGPLTFVPSDSPGGTDSTLEVRVDGLRWTELEAGDESSPGDHVYRTTSKDGTTVAVFGEGARPRTAPQNIEARYRVGLGNGGNVPDGRITTLVDRPHGVKAVVNPIAAMGGADRDDAAAIRERAPLATEALDRLVGVADYAAFALTFAGVEKSAAVILPANGVDTVVVTVSAPEDAPLDSDALLLRRLAAALRRYGDPIVSIAVLPSRRMALVLDAAIRLESDARWSDAEPAIRARLLDLFGAARRGLGQDVALARVMDAIQSTPGVDYVDVNHFGALELNTDSQVSVVQELQTQLNDVFAEPPEPRIGVPAASLDPATGQPLGAALARFFADLPETLVLSEISDGR